MPRNWDDVYSNAADLDFTPAPMLVEVSEMLPPGRALDIACGYGRNAIYLASLGWQVTAVDASQIGIRVLRERSAGLAVDARVVNLEAGEFQIPPHSFDLICNFCYLQRNLFPQIREGVCPGGVFVGAIHLREDTAHTAALQLAPGELRDEFANWKIIFYSEALEAGMTRRMARIIARRV